MNMPVRPTSGLAVTSLVAGILGWIMLPVLASLVAVVTGHMARSEIRRANGAIEGDGMALAGLILGWINLGLVVAVILFFVLFLGGLAALAAFLGVAGSA
ncbi:DUF4190 domain-containing protein [Arenimonas fontis]|uniref:DUF4190 domain-containing protein n=1 Tax=Arenimonas fontis TaxID=2608255 RepID=A0A5B2ZC66_9GAMM|nr:DUF4190 domain-containing protein [Arenimonas fontis]KAA2285505.1 DUF4190 domain-containing protein [Arenimonas fontis]